MSDIQKGDIVECIDDVPKYGESRIMPVWGQLYTVTGVRTLEDGKSVRLKELLPTCYLGGRCGCGHCGWDAQRFRRILRPDDGFLARLLETIDEPV